MRGFQPQLGARVTQAHYGGGEYVVYPPPPCACRVRALISVRYAAHCAVRLPDVGTALVAALVVSLAATEPALALNPPLIV